MLQKTMLAKRQGRKEPVYNILQTQFKNNTDSCWFASALINWGNNVLKKKITLEEQRKIEEKAYSAHLMPKAGLTVSGGLRRISETLDCGYVRFAFGSPQFHDALNAGKCVCVTIMITQSFLDQWRGTEDIGDCKGNNQGSHALNLYKKDGAYYLLNSREGQASRRLKNLNIQGLFKTWETCGMIVA